MTDQTKSKSPIQSLAFKRKWLGRLHWLLPLVFAVWIVGSVLLLIFFGSQLPVFVTNILSVAFLPFLPMIPFLRPLGMVAGYDALTVPNPAGFIFSVSLYVIVLFLIARLIQDKFSYVYREKPIR